MDFREAVFKILGLSNDEVRDKNVPQSLEAEVSYYLLIIIIYFLYQLSNNSYNLLIFFYLNIINLYLQIDRFLFTILYKNKNIEKNKMLYM